jgi:CRISPR-associated protein Csm3
MSGTKIKSVSGIIRVETGLHIGAGSDTIEIGGMDNPIIKDPVSNLPYIPGSSLKGKMRSLLEWYTGRVSTEGRNAGEPCSCGECDICTVFGSSAANSDEGREKAKQRGPTRLVVRDAFLTEENRAEYADGTRELIEEKHENSINRITAAANPRPLERVVPGTEFRFSMTYRMFAINGGENEEERRFREIVLTGLRLLELDYLGGGGSRGNGRITFHRLKDENDNELELPGVE